MIKQPREDDGRFGRKHLAEGDVTTDLGRQFGGGGGVDVSDLRELPTEPVPQPLVSYEEGVAAYVMGNKIVTPPSDDDDIPEDLPPRGYDDIDDDPYAYDEWDGPY